MWYSSINVTVNTPHCECDIRPPMWLSIRLIVNVIFVRQCDSQYASLWVIFVHQCDCQYSSLRVWYSFVNVTVNTFHCECGIRPLIRLIVNVVFVRQCDCQYVSLWVRYSSVNVTVNTSHCECGIRPSMWLSIRLLWVWYSSVTVSINTSHCECGILPLMWLSIRLIVYVVFVNLLSIKFCRSKRHLLFYTNQRTGLIPKYISFIHFVNALVSFDQVRMWLNSSIKFVYYYIVYIAIQLTCEIQYVLFIFPLFFSLFKCITLSQFIL